MKATIRLVLFMFLFNSGATVADELWINGFGSIKFGDRCVPETPQSTSLKIGDFHVEAYCRKHAGVQKELVDYISIYTNKLSSSAAQALMLSKVPEGWEFSGGLKTPGLGWTTWSLSNYRLAPYTRDMDCNGEFKNSITIYEFDEIPEHYDKVSKGRVNIRIWANKIACSEAKRIDAEISSQRANELDAEKKSSTAKSLLESLK